MKKFSIKTFIIVFAVVGILIGLVIFRNVYAQKKVHYHAGFAIFQNNKKLDFSDIKYMYIKPCNINEKGKEEHEDNQIEKAHLHDSVGDVVHVERSGAVWKDLFANIKFSLDYSKAEGFINGKRVASYESQSIKPDDTLVIFIGNNDISKDLKLAPAKDYVDKMASKSTTCGD